MLVSGAVGCGACTIGGAVGATVGAAVAAGVGFICQHRAERGVRLLEGICKLGYLIGRGGVEKAETVRACRYAAEIERVAQRVARARAQLVKGVVGLLTSLLRDEPTLREGIVREGGRWREMAGDGGRRWEMAGDDGRWGEKAGDHTPGRRHGSSRGDSARSTRGAARRSPGGSGEPSKVGEGRAGRGLGRSGRFRGDLGRWLAWWKCSLMSLPNLDELSFRSVLALPKASSTRELAMSFVASVSERSAGIAGDRGRLLAEWSGGPTKRAGGRKAMASSPASPGPMPTPEGALAGDGGRDDVLAAVALATCHVSSRAVG